MSHRNGLVFKIASEEWELEQIHRLNHRTFAEEIPQHRANAEGRLVDKFHSENTYVVGLAEGRVVAMVALRGRRPFSLDQKLPDLDRHIPQGSVPCEIRLLAVEKEYRGTAVAAGLMGALATEAIRIGYDTALISGTTRQLRLYRHMGFQPFGPQVGSGDAMFQPMLLSLEDFDAHSAEAMVGRMSKAAREPANFLPGPVPVSADVSAAFALRPQSHRGRNFLEAFAGTRRKLAAMAQAKHVSILLGSGTLANDVVAQQLRLLDAPGIILSQGEFGERLIDHARRAGLRFHTLTTGWGEAFTPDQVRWFLDAHPDARWLWVVHCETSTSVLNDLTSLKLLAAERGLRLCLDCMSTLGVVPLDLRGVHLATGTSGKGVASYPGLSFVFHHHDVAPEPLKLPRYLDLGCWARGDGVPFTHSSNLVAALGAALDRGDWEHKFSRTREAAEAVRQALRGHGFFIVGADEHASPGIVTLALPPHRSARSFGWQLEKLGFLVSYRSDYLLRRNWLQIALLGEFDPGQLAELLREMGAMAHVGPSGQTDGGARHGFHGLAQIQKASGG